MQNFITALKAENIKKKGTGIFLLSVIIAAASVLLWAVISYFNPNTGGAGIPYNYYTGFVKNVLDPFAGFFFPLLIIITVSRITQLDHKNGGWQLMETQPVTKFSIYFSKFTMILAANAIAIVSLVALSFLCGWIMTFITDVPKEAIFSLEAGKIGLLMLRLFLGALMLSAFQYALSVLLSSFIWSIVIGFFGLLLNLFLLGFKISFNWNPFELLARVGTYKSGSDLGYWVTYSETLSLLFAIILLYTGFKWYWHKGFKRAFLSKPVRIAKLAAVVVVGGGLIAWMMIPNKMVGYSETVISGTIDSDLKIKNLYITDNFITDTIAIITVTDGKFNYTIKQDIALDQYTLAADEAFGQPLVFGKNDSINIDFKFYNNTLQAFVTGTRLAENLYKEDRQFSWNQTAYYLENNIMIDKPQQFISTMMGEYDDAMSETSNFKTADNYIPREDFTVISKKLVNVEYINLWKMFLKKRSLMYPDEKTVTTPAVKAMLANVTLNDETLLTNGKYFEYVKSSLIEKNTADIDENTKAIQAIDRLKPGSFKDKMLYWQLDKSLKEAATTAERQELLAAYGHNFTNKKFESILLNNSRIIENLSKGKPAPLFDAIDITNTPFNLASLRGKYVVIDVWATWCAPCREQSPYFEKLAIKYKKENIKFVAASIDKKMDSWIIDAKAKSKSVLQLHINDIGQFSKNYDARSIPRFILIDPQGNLVNSAMPFPAEDTFEKLLRESLGLPELK